MSRSIRKTPIFGFTTSRSEAEDKRIWHKRWRARERDQLSVLNPESDYVSSHRNEVSNIWGMSKDGRTWFDPKQQLKIAERFTARKRPAIERKSLVLRQLAKWRTK